MKVVQVLATAFSLRCILVINYRFTDPCHPCYVHAFFSFSAGARLCSSKNAFVTTAGSGWHHPDCVSEEGLFLSARWLRLKTSILELMPRSIFFDPNILLKHFRWVQFLSDK